MIEYRGYGIVPAFEGWKVRESGGAYWPEKYRTPMDARRSIDFEEKQNAKSRKKSRHPTP